MSTDNDDTEVFVRPFADFLAELRKGLVHAEASEGLHDLIAAVNETKKTGTLTITLKVSVQKKTGMLEVADQVTVKAPAYDRDSSVWFVDKSGNLSRRDPSQLELPGTGIRAVPNREAKQA